jgi:acyl carrier protein
MSLSASSSKEAVLDELRSIIKSELGILPEQVEPTSHLIDDLDLDSIDLVDLTVSLEESTGLVLGNEELKSVRTVQDAVDVIHAKLVGRSIGSG